MYTAPLQFTISPPQLCVLALYRCHHLLPGTPILWVTTAQNCIWSGFQLQKETLCVSIQWFQSSFLLAVSAVSSPWEQWKIHCWATQYCDWLNPACFLFVCLESHTLLKRVKIFWSLQGRILCSRKYSKKLFCAGTAWFGNSLHNIYHFGGDPAWLNGWREERISVCIIIHIQ